MWPHGKHDHLYVSSCLGTVIARRHSELDLVSSLLSSDGIYELIYQTCHNLLNKIKQNRFVEVLGPLVIDFQALTSNQLWR
jgi:hypothetical protein